ncbi:glutamate--cysteine ligase [Natronomonas salsuginis]|jgi:carboxylate-amine ligase|uniref:Glutamate--cysteine ligase n=1 Tax=Natronomonas salsuginis TaxID=2217661 RepID=A0A4U5JGS6_9EURY|nr:glutamate--cysteine ligase [Natronomonas salsuginis]TKR28045.1 glutamate--cysteine ligase [Natronomonas salsuginis]
MDLGSRDAFDRMGTLGIEEEFFIVDADGRPTSGTDELVYGSEPPELLDGRLDHELFKFVIETQTPTIDSLDEAREALTAVRSALVDHASRHGFSIAAAGLHPAAKWRELDHAEKPRYRAQLDRIQYPQHRNTTAGLHVHVGVDDADKAVWIANELRWYLPIMLALSANSPYWNGFDTGLQSARAKIFEGLPNTGVPTAFEDFETFQRFERTMVETGSINDRGELWYDVRPHSSHGTVEVRTPDGQADPERVLAFVEYTEALVEDLGARYDDGESGHDHRREFLDENKWRALRHGHDAELLSRDFSKSIPLGELVDRERSRLGVSGIGGIYDEGSGAEQQRHLRDVDGMDTLCESLLIG